MNVSIIGGNFGINVVLPALLSFKDINIISATISSGEIKKSQLSCRGKSIPLINLEQAIQSDNVDAIFLAVPPIVQTDLLLKLMNKEIHFFLEKPLCFNVDYARNIVFAAKKRKYVTFIDYTFFGIPQISQLRALVGSSLASDYNFIWNCKSKSFENSVDSWKLDSERGGGALNNLASHFIALVDMLFGEITEIKADLNDCTNKYGLIFNESSGNISIIHKKGTVGSFIYNSNFEGPAEILLVININNTVIQLRNIQKDYFRGFKLYVDGLEIYPDKVIEDSNVDSRIQPLKKLVNDFIFHIKNNSQPELGLDLGLRVAETINICRISSKAGGVWSKI